MIENAAAVLDQLDTESRRTEGYAKKGLDVTALPCPEPETDSEDERPALQRDDADR